MNGREVPFLAEVKGVMTQGLDGLKNYKEAAKRWTKTFQVKYELHDGDLEYIVGKDGKPFTYDGNYDKYSVVLLVPDHGVTNIQIFCVNGAFVNAVAGKDGRAIWLVALCLGL